MVRSTLLAAVCALGAGWALASVAEGVATFAVGALIGFALSVALWRSEQRRSDELLGLSFQVVGALRAPGSDRSRSLEVLRLFSTSSSRSGPMPSPIASDSA